MIRAKNIMTKNVFTVHQDTSLAAAAKLIVSRRVSNLIVVDGQNPIGIVNEGDVLNGLVLKRKKVKDAMTLNFVNVDPETDFENINKLMRHGNIRHYPVVKDEKLHGIITETDIIETVRDHSRFHQMFQDTIVAVFGFATAFALFYLFLVL